MIYIDSKKKKEATLIKKYPNAKFVDVTSSAPTSLRKLSPFFPHGGIPIPYSTMTAQSVEGIWQGLKVFADEDVNFEMFHNDTMKDLKRTVRKFGNPLGHRMGVEGKELLSYLDARIKIYLPSYLWILENKVQDIVERLREASKKEDIVLLDYDTNCDVLNFNKPLSHAYLVKAFVENIYPREEDLYAELERRRTNPLIVEEPKVSLKKKKSKKKQNNNQTQTSLF